MSFIVHHENIFCKKNHGVLSRKRSFGRLKNVNSCTDSRAWGTDKSSFRKYMLETFSNVTPSSSAENTSIYNLKRNSSYDNIGIYKTVKNSMKMNSKTFLLPKKKMHSAENLYVVKGVDKLELKLIDADDKIEDLQRSNKRLKNKNSKCSIEVDNMKNLIKELQQQILHLESLKEENNVLRSESKTDVKNQLLKAEDEIYQLQKELEFFQEIELKHQALKAEHDILQEDHVSLNTALNSLKEEEQKLKNQFNSQKEELVTWKSRALDMSNIICDKNVLIEKISIKDQKLANLYKNVQNQEICIQQLNLQLSRITDECEQKQLMVARQLEELQVQLTNKSSKVIDLESKLSLMEHLVVELETLREQFRLSNNELIESVGVYKKQFYNAMKTSNQMASLVEKLQKELSEKNEELEKMKLFPQSAKTMVYFSQLNNLINSSISLIDCEDSSSVTNVFFSIQKIVSNIKNDMWGTNALSLITELSDSFSQTDFATQDIWTQICINSTNSQMQTNCPDEFVVKYQEAEKIIEKLTSHNLSLDESHKAQKQQTEILEQKYTDTLEDLQLKESLIIQLNENNNMLHGYLKSVNERLKYSDGLLVEAASQLDFESHLQSCNHQLENVLDNAVSEYSTYVNVLEVCLEYKENNLQMLYKLMNQEDSEVNETITESENITRLQSEADNLNDKLDKEKSKSEELGKVVNNLLNDISDQSCYVKEIEKKLMSAENLIENLFSNISQGEFKRITYSNIENSTGAADFQLSMILDRYKEVTVQKETNLIPQQISKGRHKKYWKLITLQKKEMKTKIIQMNTNMRRVRKIINDLRNRLMVSEKLINELQTISDLLSLENSSLKKSNSDLMEEVGGLKTKLNSFETEIKSQEVVVNQYSDLKRKMEKVIVALLKKISKYKILFDKEQMSKGTITNEYYMKTVAQRDHLNSEIDLLKTENVTLSATIFQLQERVSSLFNLPQKESKSIEIQAEMKTCISEDEKEMIFKKIKDHYEAILQALQKEHSTEKEQSQKQYRNNLKMLKDTYERDMTAIKKTHAENLTKLQSLHEEEMMIIKETQTENDKAIEENHVLQSFHQEEIEAMKIKYEKLITKKEELFKDEKEMLIAQMSKSVLDKEAEIRKTNAEMASKLMNYKVKCKLNLKKMKEKHKLDLDHIISRCKNELKRFMKREEEKRPAREEKEVQYDAEENSTSTKVNTDDKSTGINKCDTGMFRVDEALYAFSDELTNIPLEDKNETKVSNDLSCLANTNFFGSSIDIEEATISLVHGTSIYAEQISQLEAKLRMKQHEFSEKVAAYEKSIRHEKMKAKEMKLQYEQELEHSAKVHYRLGAQYNKSEELEFENQLLLKQISVYESHLKVLRKNLEKEKDKTFSMKCALNILKAEPQGSYQLELSLNRLKKKIEQAVECEKRLTEELKKENQRVLQTFDAETAIKISKYENHQINSEKVIHIQACGVVQLGMDVN